MLSRTLAAIALTSKDLSKPNALKSIPSGRAAVILSFWLANIEPRLAGFKPPADNSLRLRLPINNGAIIPSRAVLEPLPIPLKPDNMPAILPRPLSPKKPFSMFPPDSARLLSPENALPILSSMLSS